MTTTPETAWMNHPAIRTLVDQANALALEERITLVKGLIPGIADALSEEEYEQFVTFIRLKGERYHEAKTHPGEGRAGRHTPGERELEGRKVHEAMVPLGRPDRSRTQRGGMPEANVAESRGASVPSPVAQKLAQYTPVRLTADLSGLSERERRMIPLLIDAAQEMDTIFWQQAYPTRDSLLRTVGDSATRAYVRTQLRPLGPARRQSPFVPGVGPRPHGRRLLPERHDQGGVRGGRDDVVRAPARRCGASTRWSGGTRRA